MSYHAVNSFPNSNGLNLTVSSPMFQSSNYRKELGTSETYKCGEIDECIKDLYHSLECMITLMNDPEKRKLRGKKRIKISNRPMRVFAAMIKRFHFLIMYNPNLYRKQHFNASVPVDLLKNITVSELDQCIQFYKSKFS